MFLQKCAVYLFALCIHSCFGGYGIIPTDNRGISTPDMKWTGADFTWPCGTTKALLKNSGKYITKNNIATRGAISRDTFFFALVRRVERIIKI